MSRPTTRQGRYLFYRARFTARGARRRRKNKKWYLDNGEVGGIGVMWQYDPRPETSREAYHVERPHDGHRGVWSPAGGGYVVNGPPFESWPHITATSPAYLAERAAGIHRRFSSFTYHLRKVKGLARPSGRMDGYTRQVWAATFYARWQGYYPMWDVLNRRPNEEDVWVEDLPLLPEWDYPDGYRGPKYAAEFPG